MIPLLIAMQLAQPGAATLQGAPPAAPVPAQPTAQPAFQPVGQPVPAAPAAAQPPAQPVVQPWQANPGGYPQPGVGASSQTPPGETTPTASDSDDEVHWFGRLELGVGPRGFSENSALLDDLGYASVKMWALLDFAYMFHPRIGAGVFMGMNRRSSQSDGRSADLNLVSYFVGAEAPILVAGERAYAFHITPRVGFLSGIIELDNARDGESQQTAIFGGALSFQSFKYHFGGSVGLMHAPAGAAGELGRNQEYGGLYFAFGGTIDG